MTVGRVTPELRAEVAALCGRLWELLGKSGGANYGDKVALWQEIHGIYTEVAAAALGQWAGDDAGAGQPGTAGKIEAESIVVEIIDNNSGKLHRRTLPVSYCETDNGAVLSGESLEGVPCSLAFLSDTALLRLKDVLGKGRDSHRCADRAAGNSKLPGGNL
jgi:hypothetical protein